MLLSSSLRTVQESLARARVAERYFKARSSRITITPKLQESRKTKAYPSPTCSSKTRSEPHQCYHPFGIAALSTLQVRCLQDVTLMPSSTELASQSKIPLARVMRPS